MKGLAPLRCARVFALAFAISGAILVAVCAVVLHYLTLLPLANGMIRDGLNLYNSFSGRLAVSNIPGHRELLDQLNQISVLLPSDAFVVTAHSLLGVLLVVGILMLVVAFVGLAKPSLVVALLLKVKLLTYVDENGKEEVDNGLSNLMEKLGNVKLKTLAIPGAIVAGVVVLILAIHGILKMNETPPEELVLDLEQKASEYVAIQKDFYRKNHRVGSFTDLSLPESAESEAFQYRISANKFTATNRVDLNGCLAGNTWTVGAYVDGIFSKELKFSRKVPKDSNCVKLTPDFKNVGRVKK